MTAAAHQLDLRLGRHVTRTAKKHSPEIARLIPIAKELALLAKWEGITIADVREEAVRRGILTGHEGGRSLSYLGAVMRAAELVPTDRWKRSRIEKSHGNVHKVFVHPEYRK